MTRSLLIIAAGIAALPAEPSIVHEKKLERKMEQPLGANVLQL